MSKLDHQQNREIELAAENIAKKKSLKEKYNSRVTAYKSLFGMPDASIVLEDLYEQFNGSTLCSKNGVVDTSASIAQAGSREVLLYIEMMMRAKDVVD